MYCKYCKKDVETFSDGTIRLHYYNGDLYDGIRKCNKHANCDAVDNYMKERGLSVSHCPMRFCFNCMSEFEIIDCCKSFIIDDMQDWQARNVLNTLTPLLDHENAKVRFAVIDTLGILAVKDLLQRSNNVNYSAFVFAGFYGKMFQMQDDDENEAVRIKAASLYKDYVDSFLVKTTALSEENKLKARELLDKMRGELTI